MKLTTLIIIAAGMIAPGVIADRYCDRYAKVHACLDYCQDNKWLTGKCDTSGQCRCGEGDKKE